ncbi:MAG TPA: hypothetical protein VEJ84_06170 [Acidimicrobiales bacterium]|nr:hypothetical protein [Acidimicrobiales bacterium]
MGAANERAGDRSEVGRYEQLRAHALGGGPPGWRLGLALLQARGTAAWLRACRATQAVPVAGRPCPSGEFGGADELVSVLATMALAAARR